MVSLYQTPVILYFFKFNTPSHSKTRSLIITFPNEKFELKWWKQLAKGSCELLSSSQFSSWIWLTFTFNKKETYSDYQTEIDVYSVYDMKSLVSLTDSYICVINCLRFKNHWKSQKVSYFSLICMSSCPKTSPS